MGCAAIGPRSWLLLVRSGLRIAIWDCVNALRVPLSTTQTRAAWALVIFSAIQVADGVMTAAGAAQYGTSIEANPLLVFLFGVVGTAATIVAVKLFAIVCATVLHLREKYSALAILTVVYLFAAILPWTFVLGS